MNAFRGFAAAAFATLLIAGCSAEPSAEADNAAQAREGEHEEVNAEAEGPHGGRMLVDGDFTLELAIIEDGAAPEFRAWTTVAGKPLAPADVRLAITLQRLGGATDNLGFAAQADFLRSTSTVYEPHSFTVSVDATAAGRRHRFRFDSFEGRTQMPATVARAAGVGIEVAGAQVIQDALPLYGVIAANAEAVRAVSARFPGVIRSVVRSLGDNVRQGEVLAVVESDDSLRDYQITAPIGGMLTARSANPGEHTGSAPLFVVTNLGTVWAELAVFPRDLARLRPGQVVRVRTVDASEPVQGRLERVVPGANMGRQSQTARVLLDNADHRWTPGLFVNAEVLIGGTPVAVAVRAAALQQMQDATVVFVNVGDVYEARPVRLGRGDGSWSEIISGLRAGARYVAKNSFLVKADIEKSGASHDH